MMTAIWDGALQRLGVQGFKEEATYIFPANDGEEGLNNLLSIERRDGWDGLVPHYRATYISYRGDASTSTHSQYAGQWLIDDDEQKLDWDDIGNYSKQWESEHRTWDDLLNDDSFQPMEVSK